MVLDIIMDPRDRHLLDDWQRNFPVSSRPFAEIADALQLTEDEVLERLRQMQGSGRITRVGATCAPNSVSASTLAAVSAPHHRIDEVAAIIGAEPGVNHSYLREHEINLWFVCTGPNRAHVDAALGRIGRQSGLTVLDLPLVRPFNVDLGFSLSGGRASVPKARPVRLDAMVPGDRQLLQALTAGMPLVSRPYAAIAENLGQSESRILERIDVLTEAGVITRLGVIVRHRALGWRSNAMVVWDIAPDRVEAAGTRLAAHPGVTLCYERRPVPRTWPYRLYCMIHARSRPQALEVLSEAAALPELEGVRHRTLFSLQCYKQMGALISLPREKTA